MPSVWLSSLCVLGGVLALLTGLLNLAAAPSFIALVTVLAFVVEAGNGACCESPLAISIDVRGANLTDSDRAPATDALLPHVNPHINGLMGGVVGGSGNLGGIIFSTIARFASTPQTVWIMGIFGISIGAIISCINPSTTSSAKRLSPNATFVN